MAACHQRNLCQRSGPSRASGVSGGVAWQRWRGQPSGQVSGTVFLGCNGVRQAPVDDQRCSIRPGDICGAMARRVDRACRMGQARALDAVRHARTPTRTRECRTGFSSTLAAARASHSHASPSQSLTRTSSPQTTATLSKRACGISNHVSQPSAALTPPQRTRSQPAADWSRSNGTVICCGGKEALHAKRVIPAKQ